MSDFFMFLQGETEVFAAFKRSVFLRNISQHLLFLQETQSSSHGSKAYSTLKSTVFNYAIFKCISTDNSYQVSNHSEFFLLGFSEKESSSAHLFALSELKIFT